MRGTQTARVHAPRLKRYVPHGNLTTSGKDIKLSIRANSEYCEVVDKRRHTGFTKWCVGQLLGAAVFHFAGNVSTNKTRMHRDAEKKSVHTHPADPAQDRAKTSQIAAFNDHQHKRYRAACDTFPSLPSRQPARGPPCSR